MKKLILHEIALGCQTKFGCKGSGTTLKAAVNYLNDTYVFCDYVEGSIETERLIKELKNGYPHIIGANGPNGKHTWVIDGIGSDQNGYLYNCNWGYGGISNGWCSDKAFVVTSQTPPVKEEYNKEFCHIYINYVPNINQ